LDVYLFGNRAHYRLRPMETSFPRLPLYYFDLPIVDDMNNPSSIINEIPDSNIFLIERRPHTPRPGLVKLYSLVQDTGWKDMMLDGK
jgi:hypothetical protein